MCNHIKVITVTQFTQSTREQVKLIYLKHSATFSILLLSLCSIALIFNTVIGLRPAEPPGIQLYHRMLHFSWILSERFLIIFISCPHSYLLRGAHFLSPQRVKHKPDLSCSCANPTWCELAALLSLSDPTLPPGGSCLLLHPRKEQDGDAAQSQEETRLYLW